MYVGKQQKFFRVQISIFMWKRLKIAKKKKKGEVRQQNTKENELTGKNLETN